MDKKTGNAEAEMAIIENVGALDIGARRTRTTRNGRIVTDNDVSLLPMVRRYRIDAGRSSVSKGAWTTGYVVYVKITGDERWLLPATVATAYGVSIPVQYKSIDAARTAAHKMVDTWGKPKAEKAPKAKKQTKSERIAELEAQIAALQAAQAAA